jgi:tetrahydromethanopterin S-methyltransferase subunit G
MSDLTRLLQEREQIEVMMEVMQLPSSQDELRKRLDEVNRKITMLENEQEDNDE